MNKPVFRHIGKRGFVTGGPSQPFLKYRPPNDLPAEANDDPHLAVDLLEMRHILAEIPAARVALPPPSPGAGVMQMHNPCNNERNSMRNSMRAE